MKTPETDGLWALVVGARDAIPGKIKRMPHAVVQKYKQLDMGIKQDVAQFNVSENSMLPVGTF